MKKISIKKEYILLYGEEQKSITDAVTRYLKYICQIEIEPKTFNDYYKNIDENILSGNISYLIISQDINLEQTSTIFKGLNDFESKRETNEFIFVIDNCNNNIDVIIYPQALTEKDKIELCKMNKYRHKFIVIKNMTKLDNNSGESQYCQLCEEFESVVTYIKSHDYCEKVLYEKMNHLNIYSNKDKREKLLKLLSESNIDVEKLNKIKNVFDNADLKGGKNET